MKKGEVLIPFSAQTKQGREEIWDYIEKLTAPETAVNAESSSEFGKAENGQQAETVPEKAEAKADAE